MTGIPISKVERMAVFFDLSYWDWLLDNQTLQESALEVKDEPEELIHFVYLLLVLNITNRQRWLDWVKTAVSCR